MAGIGVAILLALPVVTRLTVAGDAGRPTLPDTAVGSIGPSASTALAEPTVTPDATPAPDAGSTPDTSPGPSEKALQPPLPAPPPAGAGDPTAAIARFYQDVSGHDFAAATALWSSRMQARYPPSVYIDRRFASTQRITLQAARVVGTGGGVSTVEVRVFELIGGQTRHWLGTWQLVDSGSGWLLNQPNLRAES